MSAPDDFWDVPERDILLVTPREYAKIRTAFDDSTRICVCKGGEHDCVDEPKLYRMLQDAIGFVPLGYWHLKVDRNANAQEDHSRARWRGFGSRD